MYLKLRLYDGFNLRKLLSALKLLHIELAIGAFVRREGECITVQCMCHDDFDLEKLNKYDDLISMLAGYETDKCTYILTQEGYRRVI